MYRLPNIIQNINFIDDFTTTPEGLLALGGNLNPQTLINAYSLGIFPWYNDPDPILWWHPDPRTVFDLKNLHISNSMKKFMTKVESGLENPLFRRSKFFRRSKKSNEHTNSDNEFHDLLKNFFKNKKEKLNYTVTLNLDFTSVIKECADKRHSEREGTWINSDLIESFLKLHQMGYAHSVEVWNRECQLVGGIYGLGIGRVFFGESMFSHESNTSKAAFLLLGLYLKKHNFLIIDGQVASDHLKFLGAIEIPRREFMAILKRADCPQKKPSPALQKDF